MSNREKPFWEQNTFFAANFETKGVTSSEEKGLPTISGKDECKVIIGNKQLKS